MTQLLWPCWWVCPAHFKGLKIKTLINPTSLHSSEGRTGSFLSIVSVHGADEKIFEVLSPEGINFEVRIFGQKNNKNKTQRSNQIQVAKRKSRNQESVSKGEKRPEEQ